VPSFKEDEHSAESPRRYGVALTAEELRAADAVVIVTDHSPSAVDYQLVVDEAKIVVDTRNVTAKTRKSNARIVGLASHEHALDGRGDGRGAPPALQAAGH
jgi:UDP-N-acetyl-D-glucosamine dehydrogenase